MSERYPQDLPDWRRMAEEQLARPHQPDPDELMRGMQDQYETEVMGTQRAAWDVALGALVRYGRPRCYDNQFATHPDYSPLSTGLLSLGEMATDGIVTTTAVRISASEYRINASDLPLPAILEAQKHPGENGAALRAAAQNALQECDKLLGVNVETYLLSNVRDALKNDHAMRHLRREAVYGSMKWFRSKESPDEYKLIAALEKPEHEAWSVPINAFGPGLNHYFLHRPAMPKLELPRDPSPADYIQSWHNLLEEGGSQSSRAALIMDMLAGVTGPVHELPAFRAVR